MANAGRERPWPEEEQISVKRRKLLSADQVFEPFAQLPPFPAWKMARVNRTDSGAFALEGVSLIAYSCV